MAVLQEVAEQLRDLLPAADRHTAQTAAKAAGTGSMLAGSDSGSHGTGAGSSRYGITCHPEVPAVLLQGSGPQPVDLSAGELHRQLDQVLLTDNIQTDKAVRQQQCAPCPKLQHQGCSRPAMLLWQHASAAQHWCILSLTLCCVVVLCRAALCCAASVQAGSDQQESRRGCAEGCTGVHPRRAGLLWRCVCRRHCSGHD